MVKEKITSQIQAALHTIGSNQEVRLEQPVNLRFGDYTTPIALQLAKELKKSPLQIAQDIVNAVDKQDTIEAIDVVAPGFINIKLSKTVLMATLKEITEKKEKYATTNYYNQKKIITEYTDPNPFKEFHIGHLYSNIVGESISRLLEANGAQVKRVCYQGDVGMHVAKSIWGMQQKMKDENLTLTQLSAQPVEARVKFLGQAYAFGATKYEEDETAKQEMIEINKQVYAKDAAIQEIYQTGRQWSLDYFDEIYKRLGNNKGKGSFDEYYFESNVGPRGVKLVNEYLEKGLFEKSQGAIIFPGEKYGLHSRVFINSLGLPTYEAKELGLAFTKYDDFPYDTSIIITGNEINAYFKVLITALKAIDEQIGNKTKHISHGMVRLPEGKMSSRTGKIKTGEWLLNEGVEKAKEKIQETVKTKKDEEKEPFTQDQKDDIAHKVGVGAIKYALLKNSIGNDIEFNFDESVSFAGNAGPYIQYTYVRCKAILKKADIDTINDEIPQALKDEEKIMLQLLYQFPEIVAKAGANLTPNIICTYLFELAQSFNLFYQNCPILKAESNKDFRLLLTQATAQVIHDGLYLLGIQTVERM